MLLHKFLYTKKKKKNKLVNTVMKCTVLNYTVYSNRSSEVLSLATEEQSGEIEAILKQIDIDINAMVYKKNKSHENKCFITDEMRYSKVYINITLLDCPVGFMHSEKHSCECHPAIQQLNIKYKFPKWNRLHNEVQ